MKVKIYNQNMNGLPLFYDKRERREILFKLIAKEKPDIIFLQEIVFRQEPIKISEFLKTLGYNSFFKNKVIFNSGGLLIASKFPFTDSGFKPFKDQGSYIKTDIVQRLLTLGIAFVTCKMGKYDFTFATSHLNYRPPRENTDRLTTGHQVSDLVEFSKEHENLIFGGDFNFTPDSEIYINLLKETGFREVSGGTLKTLSIKNMYREKHLRLGLIKEKGDVGVDFIFYKGKVKPVDFRMVGEEKFTYKNNKYHISDHFGIEASLEL